MVLMLASMTISQLAFSHGRSHMEKSIIVTKGCLLRKKENISFGRHDVQDNIPSVNEIVEGTRKSFRGMLQSNQFL